MRWIIITVAFNYTKSTHTVAIEDRTARLTILIDPRKKVFFERLCAEEDVTPSQVVRRLIRRYIEERTGRPWVAQTTGRPTPRGGARRGSTTTGERSPNRRRV